MQGSPLPGTGKSERRKQASTPKSQTMLRATLGRTRMERTFQSQRNALVEVPVRAFPLVYARESLRTQPQRQTRLNQRDKGAASALRADGLRVRIGRRRASCQ